MSPSSAATSTRVRLDLLGRIDPCVDAEMCGAVLSQPKRLSPLVLLALRRRGDFVRRDERRIWNPAGMEADAFWNADRSGAEIGFCCLNAVAHDWARFGLLYLNDEMARDRRILPEGWVARSVKSVFGGIHRRLRQPALILGRSGWYNEGRTQDRQERCAMCRAAARPGSGRA